MYVSASVCTYMYKFMWMFLKIMREFIQMLPSVACPPYAFIEITFSFVHYAVSRLGTHPFAILEFATTSLLLICQLRYTIPLYGDASENYL